MIVLKNTRDEEPVIVEISSPKTTVTLEDVSEHHVRLVIDDGIDAPFHLILGRKVAALIVAALPKEVVTHGRWIVNNNRSLPSTVQ